MTTHGGTTDRHDEARQLAARQDRAAVLGVLLLLLGALALLAAPLLGVVMLALGVAAAADWLRLRRLAREAP